MHAPRVAVTFPLVALIVVLSGCATEPPDDCSSNGTCPTAADATADSWAEAAADSPQGVDTGTQTTQGQDAQNELGQDGGVAAEGGDARLTGDGAVDATVDSGGGVDSGTDQEAWDSADAADGFDGFDGFDGYTCDPSQPPHDEACVIDERYGVFVAPAGSGGSDATGNGTRAKPYASIGHAVVNLGGKSRVYVCDATYAESVTLSGPASLFGGLECPTGDAGWAYLGSGAQVSAPPNAVPLRVAVPSGPVDVEDMRFVAANASAQDDAGNGASSIAAIVTASPNVTFRRCVFAAGSGESGGPGTDGASAPNYPPGQVLAPAGSDQDGGAGGAGGSVTCADGHKSSGGSGGNSGPGGGGGGVTGTAVPPATPVGVQDGLGGTGGTLACGVGAHPGANGAAGSAGTLPASLGAFSAAGWTPSPGGAGQNGDPGQGGGGGGGLVTLGGTGGGAGGCGGAGGTGGGGGGASIALVCADSSVVLDGCTLTSATAGSGGRGGNGQPGQGGGAGFFGVCSGAFGGNGAGGSAGAGGAGGISTCILYRGTLPSQLEGTTCVPGAAGAPGPSGIGGPHGTSAIIATGNNGSDGPDGGLPGVSQPAYPLPP